MAARKVCDGRDTAILRIFTRYILGEVLSHAAIGASLFTFVIFMRDLGRILEYVPG